ncbi:unnamed protein product, partial [Amoebophrya sp. A25]|eukprot:GSA25T00015916001.1
METMTFTGCDFGDGVAALETNPLRLSLGMNEEPDRGVEIKAIVSTSFRQHLLNFEPF